MEKESKKLNICSTPFLSLVSLPLLCVGLLFFWCNTYHFDQCKSLSNVIFSFNLYFMYIPLEINPINQTLEEQQFFNSHLSRLVRGEDRRNLKARSFSCDKTYHSIVCVSDKTVRIDTRNMTVYVSQNQEMVVRPYARQEGDLKTITPVHIIGHASPLPCEYTHRVPAVVFSSGSTGNAFHEMNEIIIPLFITTKHFQSRVQLIMQDYNPSFMKKYEKIITRLSAHEVMDPAKNATVHCFPGTVIGLKFHDHLSVIPGKIPGGYGMPEFQTFLRQSYGLKFTDISQIKSPKPRLVLLSRTTTRRFLNEDEVVETMREVGFEVLVIKRSKVVSNVSSFSRLINSCSVLVGVHGAGLTNQVFLPHGAVMIQVELLGTEWASKEYFGDSAGGMGVHYLKYSAKAEESSLVKLLGRNHSFVTDPRRLFTSSGYYVARGVYFDTQNVRVNVSRFRETLVEAYSIVTDWAAK